MWDDLFRPNEHLSPQRCAGVSSLGRRIKGSLSVFVVGILALASPGLPTQAAPPPLPKPESAWQAVDLMQHVFGIQPDLPPAASAGSDKGRVPQPRIVRPGLFAHSMPIREAVSPDGLWLAGTDDGALYVRSVGQEAGVILAQPSDGWRWDVEGARWAPESDWIAVRRIRDADVPRIPIVDWETEMVRRVPYSRAGEPLPDLQIWIVNRNTGETRRIEHAPDSAYLHAVAWNPRGTRLRFLEADRLLKKLDLMEFDLRSGEVQRILEEAGTSNVIGLEMLTGYAARLDDLGLVHFLDERGQFLWLSERSGVRRLYLYDLAGNLQSELNRDAPAGPIERVEHVDRDGGGVFVTAHGNPERPQDQQLYRVDLDTGAWARISDGPVIRSAFPAPTAGSLLVFRAGLPDLARIDRFGLDGEHEKTVWSADFETLRPYRQSTRRLRLPAADRETRLDALLVTPRDLDSDRRYPLIELIYGGPNMRFVPNDPQSPWLWEAFSLANQGYVVVMIDGRGTPGRGRAFHDFSYGRFGQVEIDDHRAALEQLLSDHDFIDPKRIGILGHSWGGYFALRAMLQAPGLYSAAVLAAPGVDLIDFRVAIEPYMGCLPQECPEAYQAGANTPQLDRLAGPVLIMHGTADDDVPVGETFELVAALEAAGKPYELRIFPGLDHRVQRARGYGRHLHRFFSEALAP